MATLAPQSMENVVEVIQLVPMIAVARRTVPMPVPRIMENTVKVNPACADRVQGITNQGGNLEDDGADCGHPSATDHGDLR